MTAKQIIFDVGANTGTDSIPYAEGQIIRGSEVDQLLVRRQRKEHLTFGT